MGITGINESNTMIAGKMDTKTLKAMAAARVVI
jgi:hypothetical protein